ncbi:uncharacterized protein LOC135107082 [Scylla paramamosain]|uniref:uncharacterized protein LOC135107082 n=1 Tax=Scylla paramamosain TaxID=85552 RepID=UPI003083CC8D
MKLQVAVLLVSVAGLAMAAPSGAATGGLKFPSSATEVDKETLKKTTALIEQFIPPLLKSISENNGDAVSRINKIVESSLALGREAVLLRNADSNQEMLKEIDAARESVPLIMDLVRATAKAFENTGSNVGFTGFTPFRQ